MSLAVWRLPDAVRGLVWWLEAEGSSTGAATLLQSRQRGRKPTGGGTVSSGQHMVNTWSTHVLVRYSYWSTHASSAEWYLPTEQVKQSAPHKTRKTVSPTQSTAGTPQTSHEVAVMMEGATPKAKAVPM